MSMLHISETTQGRLKQVGTDVIKSLINWTWTKSVLYWIILSAGTMSELAFLIASLWMTLNASIHDFILIFMSDSMTQHLSDIAKAAYVGLPECILPLAIATTINHIRIWDYNHKNGRSIGWAVAWSVLYGAPTLTFLGLSLWTIGCSVLKIGYTLPDWMVVTRSLGGYIYGITALLYWIIGKPQETDRLNEKDGLIARLKQEIIEKLALLQQEKDAIIADLTQEKAALVVQSQQEKATLTAQFQQEKASSLSSLGSNKDAAIAQLRQENTTFRVQLDGNKREIDRLNQLLEEYKSERQQLITTINRGSDEALQAYSQDCLEWLKSGIKTARMEDITRFTGHPKRKIETAITKGLLQTSTRNKELILIETLVNWLKNTPAPEHKTEPSLHVVNG